MNENLKKNSEKNNLYRSFERLCNNNKNKQFSANERQLTKDQKRKFQGVLAA